MIEKHLHQVVISIITSYYTNLYTLFKVHMIFMCDHLLPHAHHGLLSITSPTIYSEMLSRPQYHINSFLCYEQTFQYA